MAWTWSAHDHTTYNHNATVTWVHEYRTIKQRHCRITNIDLIERLGLITLHRGCYTIECCLKEVGDFN